MWTNSRIQIVNLHIQCEASHHVVQQHIQQNRANTSPRPQLSPSPLLLRCFPHRQHRNFMGHLDLDELIEEISGMPASKHGDFTTQTSIYNFAHKEKKLELSWIIRPEKIKSNVGCQEFEVCSFLGMQTSDCQSIGIAKCYRDHLHGGQSMDSSWYDNSEIHLQVSHFIQEVPNYLDPGSFQNWKAAQRNCFRASVTTFGTLPPKRNQVVAFIPHLYTSLGWACTCAKPPRHCLFGHKGNTM